ncbi:hypothetical protein DICPUDRAFT_90265 [Dictyostelium purpureum]|uniref:Ras guanine nucleotide exchange factor n=1 Tax=Dictyostelium purpureum TaxID=5786 RepID=F1A1E0_DICPU|nr:uncharacterized protein DICPUDRAFT_90265 [Dictyostelium purpureum]EGC29981.1 hypothetical protein DICPUDRAFT_90265 [Dictyostelium purpureum]|eukprot:XP_003293484.1 hypothetical protein DICPUDRAFT_90265 [Dictyostelium purpureum]
MSNSKSLVLLQSLTCGICSNLFKDPNTLVPCGHTFCLECLKKSSNSVKCIQCKTDYQNYIPNFPLKQMIECLDQSNNNNNNSNNNSNNNNNNNSSSDLNSSVGSNSNSNHGLISFIEGLTESGNRRLSGFNENGLKFSTGGDSGNIRYCVDHYEEYYSFCEDCQQPVCPRCLLTSHNRHGMIPLTKESISTKIKEYKLISEQLKNKMSLYKDNISLYQKEIQLLDSSFVQCKQAIQMMISNLHKSLKTRETYLLKEIGQMHYNSHFELSERSNLLENEIGEMEKLTSQNSRFNDATEIFNNQNLKFEFLEQFHISRTQSKKNMATDLKPLYKTDLLFYKANNDRVTEIISNTLGNISVLSFLIDDADNVNIWDEPKENIFLERVRINSNGIEEFEVKYGTLNKLIERLTLPGVYDENYVNIFLLTYHSFCTSKKLLKKLIERFTIPEDFEEYGISQIQIHEIHMKIRSVIIKWITEYAPVFDQDTINLFQNFNGRMQSEYTSIIEIENLTNYYESASVNNSQSSSSAPIITSLQNPPTIHFNNINNNNNTSNNNNSLFNSNNNNCKIPITNGGSSPNSPVLNMNSLSLINHSDNFGESPLSSPRGGFPSNSPRLSFGSSTGKYGSISGSSNLSGMFNTPNSPTNSSTPQVLQFMSPTSKFLIKSLEFNEIDELEIAKQLTIMEYDYFKRIKPIDLLTCVDLKHKTPNITNIMERFNNISTWVSTTVVNAQHLKGRVKIMTKFIKIAEHLKNLNNFNSLTAILVAIQRSTVTRKELVKQTAKTFADLEKIMSSDEGYKAYRQRLAQCVPPCIPYVSVYLQDIMDLEKKNPSNITVQVTPFKSIEYINFTRRSVISKVILDLVNNQRFGYPNITPISTIQEYLNVHIDSDCNN